MTGALLCEDCWSLTTDYSSHKTHPQQNPVLPGPESCDLCRLLRQAIETFRDSKPQIAGADWRLPKQKLALYHPSRYPACGVNVTFFRPVAQEEGEGGEDGREGGGGGGNDGKVEGVGNGEEIGRAELEITTPLDQNLPWGGFANAEDIAGDSGSDKAFRRLERWMWECLGGHEICNRGSTSESDMESEGPKRLIDTGPLVAEPAPKLVDCPDGNVKYCALSYCWGREAEENFITTRENYQRRRDGIGFDELLKTFRDAVVISRRLGCRYLWIDAICIIQQDRLDWESEAPRMQSIYGNAHLVIAASLSASPSSGIFTTRPLINHFDFGCAGTTYQISVKSRIEHNIWFQRERHDFKTVPLHSRAWAFQERLLARRVVHYGPSELFWECKTHCRCECSGIEWPVQSTRYKPGTSLKTEVAGSLAAGEAAKHASGAWHSIVSEYTARQLTVQTDRLPALSGLARLFAFPQMGKYLAGTWYSQLPGALDWSIKNPRRPEGYRAPSWCWASLDGPVSYVTHGGARCVELIDAGCTPAGEDPYGEVMDGYIVVKGEFGPSNRSYHRGDDYDVPVDETEELWALKLNMSDWNIWHSLFLRRSKRVEGAWERVGLGIEGDSCFDGRGESVVRIV